MTSRPLPLVGASGSIAGVIAAYLLLFRRSQLTFVWLFWQYKLPAWVWITVWVLMQLALIGLDPGGNRLGIAFWAHIGGFIAGLVLILPVRRRLIASHSLLDLLDRYQIHRAPLPVPAVIIDDESPKQPASRTLA